MAKTSWTQVVFKRKNGFKGYNSQQFPTVHFKMHQTILSFTSASINVQFPPEILGIIRLAHWKILQNFIKPGFSLFQLSTRSDVWSNGQKVWCEKPQIYGNGLHHGIIFFWFVFALHFTPWLHTSLDQNKLFVSESLVPLTQLAKRYKEPTIQFSEL